MINDKWQYLFSRRLQHGRWMYLVAAMPLLLFALMGWEYGAFALYLCPAVFCLIQYFYPTILGWFILFLIYLIGAVTYLYVYFRDLFHLIMGRKSGASLFADWDDSIVFTVLIALIVAITFNLYKNRPRQIENIAAE